MGVWGCILRLRVDKARRPPGFPHCQKDAPCLPTPIPHPITNRHQPTAATCLLIRRPAGRRQR